MPVTSVPLWNALGLFTLELEAGVEQLVQRQDHRLDDRGNVVRFLLSRTPRLAVGPTQRLVRSLTETIPGGKRNLRGKIFLVLRMHVSTQLCCKKWCSK